MTEPSRTEMTESQAKGLGALLTSFLTLVLLALGALLIQPRLSEAASCCPIAMSLRRMKWQHCRKARLPWCWIDASVRIRTTFAFAC